MSLTEQSRRENSTVCQGEGLAPAPEYVRRGEEFSTVAIGRAYICAPVKATTGEEAVSSNRDFLMS